VGPDDLQAGEADEPEPETQKIRAAFYERLSDVQKREVRGLVKNYSELEAVMLNARARATDLRKDNELAEQQLSHLVERKGEITLEKQRLASDVHILQAEIKTLRGRTLWQRILNRP
jgi:ABC-type phosphate transport system auxiliary subunit